MPDDAAPLARMKADAPARQRLLSNYFFQLVNQVLRICSQLLLVPLFLAAWGADLYKDWVVVAAIMYFLGTCNLGTSTYFGNRFIELLARGDRHAFRREQRTTLLCTLSVGVAVLLAAYGVLFGYDSSGMLQGAAMSKATIYGCLVLMTLPITFTFAEEAMRTIYRAQGEFSRGECVFAIYLCTEVASVAVALVCKMPPLVAAACYLITPIILTTGVVLDLKRRYSDIVLGLRVPGIAELRHIVPHSLLFFTSPLSLALVQSGPIMLFGILGVPALPVLSYTLVRTVTGLARQAAFQFAVGSGIEMARHHARGEREACRRLYQATGQIVTGLVGLFAGFTLLATAPFLAIWTHGTVHSDPTLVLCFLGGIFVAAPGQAGLMLLNYTNVPKPLAVAWCSQGCLGLAVSAALVPIFGVAAAAFSFAAAESLAIGLYLPFVVERRFGFSAVRQLTHNLAVGALAFAWSLLAAKLAFGLGLIGFNGLIATALLWAVVALPPFGLFLLRAERRKMLLSRIRTLAAGSA